MQPHHVYLLSHTLQITAVRVKDTSACEAVVLNPVHLTASTCPTDKGKTSELCEHFSRSVLLYDAQFSVVNFIENS